MDTLHNCIPVIAFLGTPGVPLYVCPPIRSDTPIQSATQLTLRDLPPNAAVEYSVRAYTIIGPGEAVSNITSTTDIRELFINCSTHAHANVFNTRNFRRLIYLFSSDQYSISSCSEQHSSESHLDSPQCISCGPLLHCALQ